MMAWTTRDLLTSSLQQHGLAMNWGGDPDTHHGLVALSTVPTTVARAVCHDLSLSGVKASWAPDEQDASEAWLHVVDAPVYRVWLGSRASGWRQHGYLIIGGCVQTRLGRDDAMRIVRLELGAGMVAVEFEDGTYCYADQKAADADETGVLADAVISICEEA
jgi:hypothetical protein